LSFRIVKVAIPPLYRCLKERLTVGSTLVQAFVSEYFIVRKWPPLWSSGLSSWLLTQRSRVRFPAIPHFLSSSVSGTGSTQPSWG
jgi:hypothetical protein